MIPSPGTAGSTGTAGRYLPRWSDRAGRRFELTARALCRTISTLKNIAVSLLALVAACSSKPADPRLTAAAETPPLEAATEARALVDSLTAAHLKEWAEGVEQLQAPLKAAVRRELARRAVKVREEEEPGQPATLHKEVEAIRVLTPLPPDPPPADFLDYLVWNAAHRGRDGYEEIWAMGLKAFPSLLKLRRDRHTSVLPTIGIVMSESIVGSRRWRASKIGRA